jgi:hypothetical protein
MQEHLDAFAQYPLSGSKLSCFDVPFIVLLLMQSAQSSNGFQMHRRRRQRTPSPIPEPDTEKGNELLNSGEFGRVDSAYIPPKDNKKNVARKLWMRQLKPWSVNPLSIGEVLIVSTC